MLCASEAIHLLALLLPSMILTCRADNIEMATVLSRLVTFLLDFRSTIFYAGFAINRKYYSEYSNKQKGFIALDILYLQIIAMISSILFHKAIYIFYGSVLYVIIIIINRSKIQINIKKCEKQFHELGNFQYAIYAILYFFICLAASLITFNMIGKVAV